MCVCTLLLLLLTLPQLTITCDKFYLHLPFFYAIHDIISLRDSQKEMIVHIKSATPLYVKYQQQQHMGCIIALVCMIV